MLRFKVSRAGEFWCVLARSSSGWIRLPTLYWTRAQALQSHV